MADKIIITSDGTVKGTKIKFNGDDMTSKYKVTNVSFYADSGYTYRSPYSGDTFVNPPDASYGVTYIEDGKRKSVGCSTLSSRQTYGSIGKKEEDKKMNDSLNYVGVEDDDRLKEKILDAFDNLRDNHKDIPERKFLINRSASSLCDKYMDLVNEFELKAKEEKEKQQ